MIHGIYVKSRPKSKWYLVAIAISAEGAVQDKAEALKQAQLDGHEKAEAAIQIFDSAFYIPEMLSSVKDDKPLFN